MRATSLFALAGRSFLATLQISLILAAPLAAQSGGGSNNGGTGADGTGSGSGSSEVPSSPKPPPPLPPGRRTHPLAPLIRPVGFGPGVSPESPVHGLHWTGWRGWWEHNHDRYFRFAYEEAHGGRRAEAFDRAAEVSAQERVLRLRHAELLLPMLRDERRPRTMRAALFPSLARLLADWQPASSACAKLAAVCHAQVQERNADRSVQYGAVQAFGLLAQRGKVDPMQQAAWLARCPRGCPRASATVPAQKASAGVDPCTRTGAELLCDGGQLCCAIAHLGGPAGQHDGLGWKSRDSLEMARRAARGPA